MDTAQRAAMLLGISGVVALAVLLITPERGLQSSLAASAGITTTHMEITSSAFMHNDPIPAAHTCDGDNQHPPLLFENVPTAAVSLVLIVDDPDIPTEIRESAGIEVFDHWVLYNIPPDTVEITAGEIPPGLEGRNGRGENAYTGPCPPPQYEPREHRYFFRVFALDTMLDLPAGATKKEVLEALEGHVLDSGELIGVYERADDE